MVIYIWVMDLYGFGFGSYTWVWVYIWLGMSLYRGWGGVIWVNIGVYEYITIYIGLL